MALLTLNYRLLNRHKWHQGREITYQSGSRNQNAGAFFVYLVQ